jgi:hypothetical protein
LPKTEDFESKVSKFSYFHLEKFYKYQAFLIDIFLFAFQTATLIDQDLDEYSSNSTLIDYDDGDYEDGDYSIGVNYSGAVTAALSPRCQS